MWSRPCLVLPSPPLGRPLLREGAGTLLGVLRDEEGAEDLLLQLRALSRGPCWRLYDHPLGRADGERAVSRYRASELPCSVQGGAVVGEPVDKTKRVPPFRREEVPGQRELHGDIARDALGEAQQTVRRGCQPSPDLGDAELGAASRDDHVAGQGDLAAARQGVAF